MKGLKGLAIACSALVLLAGLMSLGPVPFGPMANPWASTVDDVRLEAEVIGWDVPRSALRRLLRDLDLGVREQIAVTRAVDDAEAVFSLAYAVTNGSNQPLTLFGRETIGLFELPTVTGGEDGAVRLLITPELDPTVNFVRQPHLAGMTIEPGETVRAILATAYPFQDSWRRERTYQPDTLTFCIGLTPEIDGVPASTLGEPGHAGRFWPMGAPAPITLCETLARD